MMAVFLLALLGLLLSAFAHIGTFFGRNPRAVFPAIWLLHLGIFAVWIPAILAVRSWGADNIWTEAKRFFPERTEKLVLLLAAYVFFNFFFTIFVLNRGGNVGIIDGQRALHRKGHVVKKLTADEYDRHQAYEVRSMSGHWILFYGMATIMLYADWRKQLENELAEQNQAESSIDVSR